MEKILRRRIGKDLEEENYRPLQMDLKHFCCSATRSCLHLEGLLPEQLCLLLCFHWNTMSVHHNTISVHHNTI